MPSSYTSSLRLEQQFTGENINVWGVLLNAVLARLDAAIAALRIIPLTGNYSLTTANGTDDDARNGMIKTTGTGAFTVTVPSVSKAYIWWNACTGDLLITTGAGATVSILPGEITIVMCDGANVYRVASQTMSGQRLQNVGTAVAPTDAANKAAVDAAKAYADTLAWANNAGILPGQPGNSGLVLSTNGTTAAWSKTFATDGFTFGTTTSDTPIKLLIRGSANGIRLGTSNTAVSIEAVDNTGSGAYQPLVLTGSTVSLSLNGAAPVAVASVATAIAFAIAL